MPLTVLVAVPIAVLVLSWGRLVPPRVAAAVVVAALVVGLAFHARGLLLPPPPGPAVQCRWADPRPPAPLCWP